MQWENAIDEALTRAENGALDPATYFEQISETHPSLFVFLFDEDTRMLTGDEHDYLLFLAMIILDVFATAGKDTTTVDLDTLGDTYERLWGMLEEDAPGAIQSDLEGHPAIELCDFLIDSCTPEEEETAHTILSDAGAEIVYCKCRAVIDSVVGFVPQ